jgi:hypothetical protein
MPDRNLTTIPQLNSLQSTHYTDIAIPAPDGRKVKTKETASYVWGLLVLLSKVNGCNGGNIYDHSTRTRMLHITTVNSTNHLPLSSYINVQK